MYAAGGDRRAAAARGAVRLAPDDVASGPRPRRARGAIGEEAGPKVVAPDPRDKKIAELEREVGRQSKRAERAEALVDVQKKLAALLGTPFESEK